MLIDGEGNTSELHDWQLVIHSKRKFVITINTEKGPVPIHSWDDLIQRPGFVSSIDLKATKLKAVIGRYMFSYQVRCGLTSCNTPHNRGYLVCTEDGHETNIGKDCGQRIFGVEFQEMSSRLDRDIESNQYKEQIQSTLFRLEDHECEVKELEKKEFGAKWVFNSHKALDELCKQISEIGSAIRNVRKTGKPELFIEKLMSTRERDLLEASGGNRAPLTQSIQVGTLSGTETFLPANDIHQLLGISLKRILVELSTIEIDQLGYKELKHWSKVCSDLEPAIESLKEAITYGQVFFSDKNLSQLERILEKKDDIKLFKKWFKEASLRHATV